MMIIMIIMIIIILVFVLNTVFASLSRPSPSVRRATTQRARSTSSPTFWATTRPYV